MPPEDPALSHPLLDLSPDRRAALLVEAGLEASHAARLREGAAPLLARIDPDARILGEYLIEEVARLAAQVDALAQMQQEAALSRAERLRIDPLPHIPAARRAAALAPEAVAEEGPVAIEAGAADFIGHGWYPSEPTEGGSLRWSGTAPCATLLMPALGGGRLVVSLSLRSPFGVPLDLAGQTWFLDGMPLALEAVSNDGTTGIFEALATLPAMPAGSRTTLLLHGAQFTDPATGPRRDTRLLGLGLSWARIERAG